MEYVYAGIWLLIAIILFLRFRKESHSVYLLSGYFVVLSGWWLANELTEVDLMHGAWSWAIRGVSIAVLSAAVLFYYAERKRQINKTSRNTDGEESGSNDDE